MNKIFKIIFNKSLGRMVIVSENAKSHGKAKSTQNTKNQSVASRIKVIKPLIVISSLFLSPYIFAGNNIIQGNSCSSPTTGSATYNWLAGVGGTSYGVSDSHSFGLSALVFPASGFTDSIVMGTDCNNVTWALSNAVAIGGGQ